MNEKMLHYVDVVIEADNVPPRIIEEWGLTDHGGGRLTGVYPATMQVQALRAALSSHGVDDFVIHLAYFKVDAEELPVLIEMDSLDEDQFDIVQRFIMDMAKTGCTIEVETGITGYPVTYLAGQHGQEDAAATADSDVSTSEESTNV